MNSILRDCAHYTGEILLKSSIEEKFDILYLYYKTDISKLKSKNYWNIFKKVIKVRNELVHYKKNYMGMSGNIPIYMEKML